MNDYYKNQKKYRPSRRTSSSFGEKIGSLFDVVMATMFSTTFLGFCAFLVLFSIYVTPKDISYFKIYAKNQAQNLVENTSTLASNASNLATEVVSDLANKYEEYKEKEKELQAQAQLAKAEPVNLTQNFSAVEVEVQLNSSTSKITYFSQTDPRWVIHFTATPTQLQFMAVDLLPLPCLPKPNGHHSLSARCCKVGL